MAKDGEINIDEENVYSPCFMIYVIRFWSIFILHKHTYIAHREKVFKKMSEVGFIKQQNKESRDGKAESFCNFSNQRKLTNERRIFLFVVL